jgi:hypothetical protein
MWFRDGHIRTCSGALIAYHLITQTHHFNNNHKQLFSTPSSLQTSKMQFITAATIFAAAALAAPTPQTSDCPNPAHCGQVSPTVYENVDITDFSLRKNNGVIQSVNFKLTGDEAKTPISCSIPEFTSFPSEMVTCDNGNSKYRVVMIKPKEEGADADMAIYHETGPAVGLWQEAPLPPNYCHAGGNGVNDFICSQVPNSPVYTVVLTPSGPFEGQN